MRFIPTTYASDAVEAATYRKLQWRLIPFLMFCYLISYLDRINVGFAKLQMLDDLRFSETVYGLGAGVFFLGYILFGVPSNAALKRVGTKRWIACIMVTWGMLSGLMAFVATPAQFFVLRFLLGAAEAGFLPGVILYLTSWFPDRRRARVIALFQMAIPLAGLFGGPLSGWIMDHMNIHAGLRGWQWLFLIEALPAVLAGMVTLAWLDNGIAQARWLDAEQKALLLRHLTAERAPEPQLHAAGVFTDWRVWIQGCLVLGFAMGLYGISFWMPTILKDAAVLSLTQIGWLSMIPNLAPILAMFLFARSSDLSGERRWHVACAGLLGASGLVGTVLFQYHLGLALISLSLATSGVVSALPMQWGLLNRFAAGSGTAAAIALINSIGNLGGITSPALLGWLKDKTLSLDAGLYVVAGCVLASGLLALSFPRNKLTRTGSSPSRESDVS